MVYWLRYGRELLLTQAIIHLSPHQQRIAEELLRRPGTFVDRRTILDAVYQGVPETSLPDDMDGRLRVEIHNWRKNMDEAGLDGMAALPNDKVRGYKLVVPPTPPQRE